MSAVLNVVTMSHPYIAAAAEAAVDWHAFKTDAEADQWLRDASATYAMMVEDIESRKNLRGYRFVSKEDVTAGCVAWVDGVLEIQLHPKLEGPLRVSVLIFEMANAYRNPEHQEIDRAVDEGYIRTPEEFGLAHEMLEYEAMRYHQAALKEIESRTGALSPEFFYLVTPAPPSAAEYRLPRLYTYLKTQRESGHTAHYYRWFHRRRSEQQASEKSSD
jgi:hypothetical protein